VPSFGKGLVQQVYELSHGTALALTTAYYYTPSGRSIQRPLHDGQLAGAAPGKSLEYHTAAGRPVKGGGGINPDHVVFPEPMGRLRIVLEASASFPAFATEAIRTHAPIHEDFEVTDSLLDEFQAWLTRRSISPSVSEWSPDREWIRSRLKQEIFNQSLGVDQGDRVELERDPRVRKALEAIRSR
jgi:carboxyl-terminal processing protease